MKRLFMYLGAGIMVLASASCKHETGEQKMTLPLIKTWAALTASTGLSIWG